MLWNFQFVEEFNGYLKVRDCSFDVATDKTFIMLNIPLDSFFFSLVWLLAESLRRVRSAHMANFHFGVDTVGSIGSSGNSTAQVSQKSSSIEITFKPIFFLFVSFSFSFFFFFFIFWQLLELRV